MASSVNYGTILLRCTRGVIYFIPFLPLFIAPSVMFPYITGKNFAFRIIIELAAVLWSGLLVTNKHFRPQNSAISTTILLFTFIVGLADLLGINPYNSFWSNYERMEGYITILHLVLFFLIIKSVFKTKKDWVIFFSIYLAVSVMVSLFSFMEHSSIIQPPNYIGEYGNRRAGTIGNPPFLAAYLLLSVYVGLILILLLRKTYLKLICAISIVINSLVIYMTAARGAILAAIFGAIVIGVSLIIQKFNKHNKARFAISLLIILGLIGVVSVAFIKYSDFTSIKNNKTVSRLMMISLDDSSIDTRIEAWKVSWNGFKERPILGWGQENFIGVYTVNPIPIGSRLIWLDRAHNVIFDWLINAGILGLFSYLAIYGSIFFVLWNYLQKKIISKNEFSIISTAIMSYFIHNLFTFDTISSYLIFFTLIAFIDNIELARNGPCLNEIDDINTKVPYAGIIMFAFIVFVTGSYFISYIPIKQLRLYSNISTTLSKYESFLKLSKDFNKALSYRAFGDSHIRDVMQEVSIQIFKDQFYEQEGALELVNRTIEETEKELSSNNLNLEYLMNAFGFYHLLSQHDPSFIKTAEMILKKCMIINPQYQRLELDMIDIYLLKKDYISAINNIKRILKLHPGIGTLHFKLAVASILTLDDVETEKALNNYKISRAANLDDVAVTIEPVFNIRQLYTLAQAHFEVKNFTHAINYYSEILINLSNFKDIQLREHSAQPLRSDEKVNFRAKIHLEIAKVYIAMGDEVNAIKEARTASELSPGILMKD